jgi:hypothetical protein
MKVTLEGATIVTEDIEWMLETLAWLRGQVADLLATGVQHININLFMQELDAILQEAQRRMSHGMVAAQAAAWALGVDAALESLGLFEMGWQRGLTGVESELIRQFLTTDRIVGVTGEVMAAVTAEVVSGVMLEKSTQQLMTTITEVIGIRDMPGFRQLGTTGISAKAERIVRTELMTILNAGKWQQFNSAADQLPGSKMVWIATGDNRTRLSHLIAHGQEAKDGYFLVGSEYARFPGDPSLSPGERINCRCTVSMWRDNWGTKDEFFKPIDSKIEDEKKIRAEQQKSKG